MEVQEIVVIGISIISVVIAIVGLFKHLDDKIDRKYNDLNTKLDNIRQSIRQEIYKDLESLALIFYKLFDILKNKNLLSPNDIFEVFGKEYLQRYSGRLSNPDSYKEKRKAELIRKAQTRTITYEEALELQRLLEEQKERHKSSGDIMGAILALILLIALLWLISEIFKEEVEGSR